MNEKNEKNRENNFDESSFMDFVTEQGLTDEKLSTEEQLLIYGFTAGWMTGCKSNREIMLEAESEGLKNFQAIYQKKLGEDLKKFRKNIGF